MENKKETLEGIANILRGFNGVCHISDETEKIKTLTDLFKSFAIDILYKGHFEADDDIRVYPTDIEFYYHEDFAGGLKDPIMYHTNDRLKDRNVKDLFGNRYPYFRKYSLNFHPSGIDVTFENEDKQYRASFLIRGYKVVKGKSEIDENKPTRPTYLYEYLFSRGFIPGASNIKWVSDDCKEKIKDLHGVGRLNVFKYKRKDNGEYVKDKKGNFLKTDEPCDREWRFIKR